MKQLLVNQQLNGLSIVPFCLTEIPVSANSTGYGDLMVSGLLHDVYVQRSEEIFHRVYR